MMDDFDKEIDDLKEKIDDLEYGIEDLALETSSLRNAQSAMEYDKEMKWREEEKEKYEILLADLKDTQVNIIKKLYDELFTKITNKIYEDKLKTEAGIKLSIEKELQKNKEKYSVVYENKLEVNFINRVFIDSVEELELNESLLEHEHNKKVNEIENKKMVLEDKLVTLKNSLTYLSIKKNNMKNSMGLKICIGIVFFVIALSSLYGFVGSILDGEGGASVLCLIMTVIFIIIGAIVIYCSTTGIEDVDNEIQKTNRNIENIDNELQKINKELASIKYNY